MNRALARAILMRHPPLNSFVFFCCFSGVNPGVCGVDKGEGEGKLLLVRALSCFVGLVCCCGHN
jgi:hypothetical protein